MSTVLQRFLQYVSIHTTSDPESSETPSTPGQWDLAKLLKKQLEEMGASDVCLDPHCIVYASIPATTTHELPALGFLAHMDTSDNASGKQVSPRIVSHYDGNDIPLDKNGKHLLSPSVFPALSQYIGQDLVVTDGTTLLGADDKAGIAEIMTMAEYLLSHPEIPHGPIKIAFTPDEEGADGISCFDTAHFGADFAYTVDGGELGEIEYENFNAASLTVTCKGRDIHPGLAKDTMINALHLAMEFHQMLPAWETPGHTCGYEGFYHLLDMKGNVDEAVLSYIIRDHDTDKFQQRKQYVREIADYMNHKYQAQRITLNLTDSYYNMKEKILPHMHLIDNAKRAMTEVGMTPVILPIRGGTDGARLSYMGLPCPNLCTGGHNCHGIYEFIPVQSLEQVSRLLIKIAELYGQA
ncbi:MAG: peptidase T [Lachnospiraceae bacterium]|jgi:tripeptide aminopeptidase